MHVVIRIGSHRLSAFKRQSDEIRLQVFPGVRDPRWRFFRESLEGTQSRAPAGALLRALILCVLGVLCVENQTLLPDDDAGLVFIHLAGRLEEAPDDA